MNETRQETLSRLAREFCRTEASVVKVEIEQFGSWLIAKQSIQWVRNGKIKWSELAPYFENQPNVVFKNLSGIIA